MAYIDDVYSVVQIQPTGIEAFVRLSQNENGRRLYFAINGGEIPTGSTATLSGTKPDGVVYSKTGTITGNVVTILEDIQLTAAAGPWPAKLRILNGGNVVATGRIRFVIDKDPVAAGAVPSDSQLEGLVAEAAAYAEAAKDGAYYGSPLTASTVAGMTDTNRVYVYTGSESGYTAGNWYFWNGSAWTSGGVYNSQGLNTDTSLSVAGMAADAKATGDALADVQVETDKTLTQADVPADAKVVGDEIADLKADLTYINVKPINLINTDTMVSGVLDGNGVLSANTSYKTTDFILVSGYNSLIFSNCNFFGWYDANKTFISPIQAVSSLNASRVAQKPSNACYLRITIQNDRVDTAQCGANIARANYVPHEKFTLPNLVRNEEIDIEHLNLFDKSKAESGYLDGNGVVSTSQNYITSTFIDVSGYATLILSYTNFIAWYDVNKAFISLDSTNGNSITTDKTIAIPSNAIYMKATGLVANVDAIQVGKNVTRQKYIPYNYYKLINLVYDTDAEEVITVDINGGGDYTSFTAAVYDNVNNGKPIVVKAGTYDIVAEYIAKFGQNVVDNLADSTSGINDFQYGIRIHDRKVTFEAGSHLICDWTGHTVNGTHRFCALRIEPNAELIGLDLDCTATFYCIHDDYGTTDNSPFTIKYKNCRVIGHNIFNANCIGGGCHKYSRHILDNCYFNNNVNSSDLVLSADVRYHNTNTADAEPEVYVSNCYFSNNMNLTYYGTQTTKMRAYVNNCFAPKGINKRAESSSMNVDNVELYTWNNQTN